MLDAEGARALEKPVHRRAVEGAGAAEAIGPGHAREQLHVHFLREPPERAVGELVAHLVEGAGLQMVRSDGEHLRAHVEAVERLHVQPIEDLRRRLDARPPRGRAIECGRR